MKSEERRTLGDRRTAALNKGAARLDIAVQNTTRRIGQKDLSLSVRLLLQEPSNSSKSTTSTGGASEAIDLALQLLPDLGSSGLDMGLTVGSVVELVGPDGVVKGLSMAGGLVVVILGVVECHSGDWVHLGAYYDCMQGVVVFSVRKNDRCGG